MIEFTFIVGNDEAQAFRRELGTFVEQRLLPKMTGQKNDRRDTATPAYVVAKRIIALIDEHDRKIKEAEREEREGRSQRGPVHGRRARVAS